MVLKSDEDRTRVNRPKLDTEATFAVLGWMGLAFLVVGGMDFLLVWYPPSFASREWQFAVVTRSFSSLPVPTMGLGLLIFASVKADRRWWAFLGAAASAVVALAVVVGVVLWGVNIPLALTQVPDQVATGMYRSIARTAVQAVAYPSLFVYLSLTGLRAARSIHP